jgi:hypothetical protein
MDIKQIMLIQPNNVTFGKYHMSEVQENIITAIVDQIQNYITTKKDFLLDKFNQPYIEILCDEVGGRNHKKNVINEAKKMIPKIFEFKYVDPNLNKEMVTTGTIITTITDIKKTNKIRLTWNVWAIPFFLYYGKGVGGTRFLKSLAISLPGQYTKRIYKLICSQRSRKEYYYNIDQFKSDLCIPDSYTNNKIKKQILEPAMKHINPSVDDVAFTFDMIARKKTPGRKPKADTIVFYIQSSENGTIDKQTEYGYIYRWMMMVYGSSDKPRKIADMLSESVAINKVFDRIRFWEDQMVNGNLIRNKMINMIKKMMREDYGIN